MSLKFSILVAYSDRDVFLGTGGGNKNELALLLTDLLYLCVLDSEVFRPLLHGNLEVIFLN
jgi:hypothetical protein